MAKFQQWAEDLESSFAEYRRLILEARRRLGHLEGQVKRKEEDEEREAELKEVQAEVKKLEKDEKFSLGLLEEHQRDEKKLPWNVDTTCREGFSKVRKTAVYLFHTNFKGVTQTHSLLF